MDKAVIKKTQKLANLKIPAKKQQKIQTDVLNIVDYVKVLQEVSVNNYPASFNASGLKNVCVNDKVNTKTALSQNEALANANQTYKGYIKVKKVI